MVVAAPHSQLVLTGPQIGKGHLVMIVQIHPGRVEPQELVGVAVLARCREIESREAKAHEIVVRSEDDTRQSC